MTAEEQARRALNAYSPGWRQAHGEALIGTLLDAAEADQRDRLTRAELADTVFQGLLQRGRMLANTAPARLLGVVGLLIGGALAFTAMVLGEVVPRYAQNFSWTYSLMLRDRANGLPGPLGPFPTTGPVLYFAWFLLVLAALAGRAGLVRRVAVLAVFLAAVLTMSESAGLTRPPMSVLVVLGGSAVRVALAPWRRGVAIGGAVAVLFLGCAAIGAGLSTALRNEASTLYPWYDWSRQFAHYGAVGRASLGSFTLLIALAVAVQSMGRRLDTTQ